MEKACRYWEGRGEGDETERREGSTDNSAGEQRSDKKKEQEIEWAKQIEINGLVI